MCMKHAFEIKIPSKCSTDWNPWEWGWYDWILRIQHGWVILDQGVFSCYATFVALVSNVFRGYCRVASQFPGISMLFCRHWLKWIGWIGDNSKPKERSRVCRVKKRLVTRLSCLLRTLCPYIESKKILNTDCPLLLCMCFVPANKYCWLYVLSFLYGIHVINMIPTFHDIISKWPIIPVTLEPRTKNGWPNFVHISAGTSLGGEWTWTGRTGVIENLRDLQSISSKPLGFNRFWQTLLTITCCLFFFQGRMMKDDSL